MGPVFEIPPSLDRDLRAGVLNVNSGAAVAYEAQSFATGVVTWRAVSCLGLLFAASWGLVYYLGKGIASEVADLYPLRVPDFPYFQPNHVGLLYVLLPVVFTAVLYTLLAPGICLVLAFAKARRWTELMILGFGASFLLNFFVSTGLKLIMQEAMNSGEFLAAEGIVSALTCGILAWRVYRGAELCWPLGQKTDRRRFYWTIAIPIVGVVALLPVIFWQDPSADGFGALEAGRSLSARFLPRYPSDIADGLPGPGVGMIATAFPVHWFVMFFGLIEAAPRLPILLYLPVLFCLLIQLIELRSPRSLGVAEEAILVLALAIYTVTMSFNASYDVYFADIASPTAFETLTIVCMLASIYFLWTEQDLWFFYFALLGYLCRPTGLMVLGLAGVSIACYARERRQQRLSRIAIAVGLCLVVGFLYEKIAIASVAGTSMVGYSSSSVIARFHFLTFDDFSRINFALFPCGILPFISLFAIPWQDSLGRVLSLLTIMYFGIFYIPAFVALHHFVPVMIVPLVPFWRLYLFYKNRLRKFILPAAAVAAGVSFWLSLPRHFEINRTHRKIGFETDYRVGDYSIDYRKINHANLLLTLLLPDWDVKNPSQELVASPYTIIFYASKTKDSRSKINYMVQLLREPPPSGFTRMADDGVAGLYIRDLQQWHKDRFRTSRTNYQSRLYYIPRATLFPHWGVREGNYSVDLLVQIEKWLPGSEGYIRKLTGRDK